MKNLKTTLLNFKNYLSLSKLKIFFLLLLAFIACFFYDSNYNVANKSNLTLPTINNNSFLSKVPNGLKFYLGLKNFDFVHASSTVCTATVQEPVAVDCPAGFPFDPPGTVVSNTSCTYDGEDLLWGAGTCGADGFYEQHIICSCVTTYNCIGSIPSNSTLCSNSSTSPSSDTNNTLGSCDGAACRYSCNAGYHDNGAGGCDADVVACGGTKPGNSIVCGSTNGNATWPNRHIENPSGGCDNAICGFYCPNGYSYNSANNTCDAITVNGCTDPKACNYNPSANTDDNSCVVPGGTCTSAQNSCGTTNGGTYACNAMNNGLFCNATTPADPINYGNSCNSTANSCGSVNAGTINCAGACTATTPADPANYGNSCQSAPNSCGMRNNGTIDCNGNCNAVQPGNPANLGQVCTRTSSANSCGLTNTTNGIYQCDGSCDAVTPTIPSESACTFSCQGTAPDANLYVSCGNPANAVNQSRFSVSTCGPLPCSYRAKTCSELGNCPISGVCGSSDGAILSSTPTTNLCSQGTPSSVSFVNNQYIWTCAQSNGGSSASCIAYSTPSCDNVNAGACTIGTAGSDNNASCGSRTWSCTNAGQTTNCQKSLTACTYNCTGTPKANSILCVNDDQGLTVDTALSLVASCTSAAKCEYICNNGYDYDSITQTCKPTQPSGPLTNNSITGKVYISGTNTPIPYVSTYLYSGATVMSGMSGSSNGYYMFTGLVSGNYSITIKLPDGYDGIKNSPLLYLLGNTYLSYDFPLWHCGSNNEFPCTENNCANPVCLNGCDAGLVVVGGRCIPPAGQLVITKTSISTGTIGSDIYYKLSIQNNKNITVTDVMVMDYLPSTVTYVSSQPNGNMAGNLVYWNGITMLPGSTGEYFIHAIINNTATGNIVNIGYVGTGTTPTNFTTGGSSTVTNSVKFQNNIRGLVYISGTTTPITGVLVSLYSGVQNISGYTSNSTGYIFSGLNNGNYAITIVVPVGYAGSNISNIIGLIGNTGAIYNFPLTPCGGSGQIACDVNSCKIPPCNQGCDAGLVLVGGVCVPQAGQVVITKTHLGTGHNAGSSLSYKLTVTNYKNVTVNDIMVMDTLPSSLTYVSSNPNAIVVGNTIYWTNIILTPNQSIDLSISTNILSNTSGLVINNGVVGTGTSTGNFVPTGTGTDILPICGRLDQPSCNIPNCTVAPCGSCNIGPCTQGCDVGLVNVNGICKNPGTCACGGVYPSCNTCGGGGGTPKSLYCRDKQDIYLYPTEVKSTDIAGSCGSPITEYITICRNNQNLKVLKDYTYLRGFVQSGDTMGECIVKPKIIDFKKYLNLATQTTPLVLNNIVKNKTPIPSTGIEYIESTESVRK